MVQIVEKGLVSYLQIYIKKVIQKNITNVTFIDFYSPQKTGCLYKIGSLYKNLLPLIITKLQISPIIRQI